MATPPRTTRPPKADDAGVSAARIRLGRVFRVESKDYFLLLGTTLFLVVFGLVMVLSSSSVESNLEDGGFFVQATRQGLYALFGVPIMLIASRMPERFWMRGRVAAAHRRVRAPAARRGDAARHHGRRQHELARDRSGAVPAVGAHQGRARDLARAHRHEEAGAARRLHARHPADPPRRRRGDRPRAPRRRPRHRHDHGRDAARRALPHRGAVPAAAAARAARRGRRS